MFDFAFAKSRYGVKTQDTLDWSGIPKAPVAHRVWEHAGHMEVFGQIAYLRNTAFAVRLTAYEAEPLTRFAAPYDPVYTDSCLEFFANFAPASSDVYLNYEVNSAGAYLIGYGPSRAQRKPLSDLTPDAPAIAVTKKRDFWSVELTIPLSLIEQIYGKFDFRPGYSFAGNLYKCGDDCAPAHHLMWSPVVQEKIDFHVPAFFGEFIIE